MARLLADRLGQADRDKLRQFRDSGASFVGLSRMCSAILMADEDASYSADSIAQYLNGLESSRPVTGDDVEHWVMVFERGGFHDLYDLARAEIGNTPEFEKMVEAFLERQPFPPGSKQAFLANLNGGMSERAAAAEAGLRWKDVAREMEVNAAFRREAELAIDRARSRIEVMAVKSITEHMLGKAKEITTVERAMMGEDGPMMDGDKVLMYAAMRRTTEKAPDPKALLNVLAITQPERWADRAAISGPQMPSVVQVNFGHRVPEARLAAYEGRIDGPRKVLIEQAPVEDGE